MVERSHYRSVITASQCRRSRSRDQRKRANSPHRGCAQDRATVSVVEADDLRSETMSANEAGERLIADRLDALEAERVIHRALELEAESLDEPHIITTDQLERIAREIGVDPSFVHQALGEVRLQAKDRSRFATWVLPEDLIETATLSGLTRDDVDASIRKWMTQNEGLMPAGEIVDGMEWDVDRGWKAKALSGTLSGGNRLSKVAGSDIAHRVHTVSENEHVVALHSEGRGPLLFAKALMALGAGLSVVTLLSALSGGSFLAAVLGSAVLLAASAAGGVAGARWWARGIRGALRRSLMGLVNRARPARKGWFARRRKDKK